MKFHPVRAHTLALDILQRVARLVGWCGAYIHANKSFMQPGLFCPFSDIRPCPLRSLSLAHSKFVWLNIHSHTRHFYYICGVTLTPRCWTSIFLSLSFRVHSAYSATATHAIEHNEWYSRWLTDVHKKCKRENIRVVLENRPTLKVMCYVTPK